MLSCVIMARPDEDQPLDGSQANDSGQERKFGVV